MPARPGMSAAIELDVADADTAVAVGSGEVPVLATPRVLALCEEASVAALVNALGPNETTVGVQVQLDHVAPTGVGRQVSAEATVEKVAGRRITFTVTARDERGVVAVGRITRVVVDRERFLEKIR